MRLNKTRMTATALALVALAALTTSAIPGSLTQKYAASILGGGPGCNDTCATEHSCKDAKPVNGHSCYSATAKYYDCNTSRRDVDCRINSSKSDCAEETDCGADYPQLASGSKC